MFFTRLEIKHVSCGYDRRNIVRDMSIDLDGGEILCLLGPNGVGKTTLFKTILGFLKPQGGEILLDGENIATWPRRRLAKAMGYVPQAHTPPFPFKVLDVVLMGRTAHIGLTASPSPSDAAVAEEALDILGISFLRDRIYTEISGGERQMVLITRALAQQPRILVMDEPTANLDFGNQIRVLGQIARLAGRGLGIIMTSHFPDHALLCSTKVVLMQRGHVFATGSADEVVTEENLRQAYGVGVKIITAYNKLGRAVRACVPLLTDDAVAAMHAVG